MDRVDIETNQHHAEQEAGEREYERVVKEYRADLVARWPYTAEGRAAIADMIADNSQAVADILASREYRWRVIELSEAIDRMAERAADDLVQNASIGRITQIIEETGTDMATDILEDAEEVIKRV